MRYIFKKKTLMLLICFILIACNKETKKNNNLFMVARPFNVVNDTVLRVVLINNTPNNYFITMDTKRMFDYSAFNYKINKSIIISPKIYCNGKRISLEGIGTIAKSIGIDYEKIKCIKKEVAQSDQFYLKYIQLKNGIFIKKRSSKNLIIPMSLRYKSCYFNYYYNLEKNKKYVLQLEYQMLRETTEKYVNKRSLDSVNKIGYEPYYEKIVSNKVPLILN